VPAPSLIVAGSAYKLRVDLGLAEYLGLAFAIGIHCLLKYKPRDVDALNNWLRVNLGRFNFGSFGFGCLFCCRRLLRRRRAGWCFGSCGSCHG
jgi:hypothetical protein